MKTNPMDAAYLKLYFPGDDETPETQIEFRGQTAVPFILDIIYHREPQPGVPRETRENDLQTLQDAWIDWSDKTFGGSPLIAGRKLMHESQELLHAVELENKQQVKKELADVFMIVLDVAGKFGINVRELMSEATDKFNVNKSRTWIQQQDGTFQHKEIEPENTVEIVVNHGHIAFDLCMKLKRAGLSQCSNFCFVSSPELLMEKQLIHKNEIERIGGGGLQIHCDAFRRYDIFVLFQDDVLNDEMTVNELCKNAKDADVLFTMNTIIKNIYSTENQ